MFIKRLGVCLSVFSLLLAPSAAQTKEKETTWKSPFLESVRVAPHLEPALQHPTWDKETQEKLAALEKKHGRKPNIVIFMVDDMGWGDPGVYGGGAAIGAPTPNIDKMAHQGLMLTSTYSQPSCTPTRAAFQTGRLPQRSGQTRPTAAGEAGRKTSEIYLAKILSDAGYKTAMAGKDKDKARQFFE